MEWLSANRKSFDLLRQKLIASRAVTCREGRGVVWIYVCLCVWYYIPATPALTRYPILKNHIGSMQNIMRKFSQILLCRSIQLHTPSSIHSIRPAALHNKRILFSYWQQKLKQTTHTVHRGYLQTPEWPIGERNEENDRNAWNQGGYAENYGGNAGNRDENEGNQGKNLCTGVELMNWNCGEE